MFRLHGALGHPFFGIVDGPVLSIPVTQIVPNPDGTFGVDLPDFANDPVTQSFKGQAGRTVTALEGDHAYRLEPGPGAQPSNGDLAIVPEYASTITFLASRM
jgi:hypothetical protein